LECPGKFEKARMQPAYKPDDLSRMRVISFLILAPEKEKQSPATSDTRRYWVVRTIAYITWTCKQIIARKFLVADLRKKMKHMSAEWVESITLHILCHLP
jgi:hypothetical protein